MADDIATHDANRVPTLIGVTTAVPQQIRELVTDNDGRLATTAVITASTSSTTTLSSSTSFIGNIAVSSSVALGLTTTSVVGLTTNTVVTNSTTSVVGLTTTSLIGLSSTNVIAVSSVGVLPPIALTTSVLTGQTIASSSSTAVLLGSGGLTNGVIVQAMSSNVNPIYVGSTAVTGATGFQLAAGQADSFAVSNLNCIGVTGTSGDAVAYNGS